MSREVARSDKHNEDSTHNLNDASGQQLPPRYCKQEMPGKQHRQHKQHKSQKKRDPRITAPRFSWKEFLSLWILIMVIGTGEILILSEYMVGLYFNLEATLATLGYCALMAFIAVLLTMAFRRSTYEKPIRALGDAARRVAAGDFTVKLPRLHKRERKDYMDVMYEDFNTMVEELGSIETLKDDFVGTVSHEIKTPLATIENYASALNKSDLNTTERTEYIQAITEATKRLSSLVSNILRLNKIENQGIIFEAHPYDLSEQLRTCVLQHEDLWEEKALILEVDVDDDCVITQDAVLMELVWNNLIANAIKFTPSGGSIKVTQRADSASVYVEVSDTGCGMDDITQRRIFDKFYQGDASHASEGNGLGLALVALALNLTGGEITVKSAPGEGSTFAVWLSNN